MKEKVQQMARVVAVCLLVLMLAPRGSAQTTLPPLNGFVVNAYNPNPNPPPFGPLGPVPIQGWNCEIVCAEGFSIGAGGAYVNQLDLGLVWTTLDGGVTSPCTFTMSIMFRNPDNSIGFPALLQRNESLPPPATPAGQPVPIAFTDTFAETYLPPGDYYLMMTITSNFCEEPGLSDDVLDWNLDAPAVAGVGPAFAFMNGNTPSGRFGVPWITVQGTFAFDLKGPILFPPTGGSKFEKSRLLVAGPVTPPPGGPVQAQLGFVNVQTGALLGQLQQVTLNPGQIESVDLDLTPYVARVGQRIEVQPVIVQSPNAAGANNPSPTQISATLQTLDEFTGFQAVSAPLPQPGTFGPRLAPQILAGGQTMRFDALASPFDSCVAQVSFNDRNGNPLIPSMPLNLAPGTGTTVDLNANALGFGLGREIEVQPVLTPTAPAAAVAQNSVCIASVEVFDHLTGRTWSHQSMMVGLPAVQSPAGGTPGTPASGARTQ